MFIHRLANPVESVSKGEKENVDNILLLFQNYYILTDHVVEWQKM